jgi:hypothetical protein
VADVPSKHAAEALLVPKVMGAARAIAKAVGCLDQAAGTKASNRLQCTAVCTCQTLDVLHFEPFVILHAMNLSWNREMGFSSSLRR